MKEKIRLYREEYSYVTEYYFQYRHDVGEWDCRRGKRDKGLAKLAFNLVLLLQ